VIEFRDVSIHYGTQDVLTQVSFRVNAGEHVGIVGPNGAGKSTLFHLLLGERLPDGGQVILEGRPTIGHIRQHLKPLNDSETLLAYALRGVPRLHELEADIHRLEALVAATGDDGERARLLRQVGARQNEFEHLGGYQFEAKVKVALGGLGYPSSDFDKPFRTFSGGWQMRAELARILAALPDLLLLDEPSNYLDLPAVEWLQRFLRGFEGTLLLISHDRYLLRSLTTTTIEIDAGTATRYSGDLDFYLRERDIRYANLLAAKENQDRRREQIERFVERFKAKSSKATQAQSRQKMLDKMEPIRLPKRSQAAACLRVAPAPHCGAEVARVEQAGFSYDGARPVLSDVNLQIARGDKVAIVGYNGMGKTTLLRLLAGVRQPTAGKCVLGHKVIVGYQSQEYAETIPDDLSVLGCAKRAAPAQVEKVLRTQLGSFGFTADDVNKPAGVLSGGEKIRLAFLQLFLNPPNFMLLDEPTTHLDLEGRRALEQALLKYDGTVCLVSHDVAFVRAVATSIIEISPAGVRRFPGGYDYYREKVEAANASAAAAGSGDPEEASVRLGGASARDLRRVRAQERAKRQPHIRRLKEKVTKAETRIGELETEHARLTAALSSGSANVDFAGDSRRLKQIGFELHTLTLDWESAAAELEQLERDQALNCENITRGPFKQTAGQLTETEA